MIKELEQAKFEAERARSRFAMTLDALQDRLLRTFQKRLTPSALASQAWNEVREKGGEFADDAVEAVKARPIAATGAVAAFLVFLARGRIASTASRLWSRTATDDDHDARRDGGKKARARSKDVRGNSA